MAILFANNCATRLAANISAADVALTVTAGTGARYPTINGASNPNNDYFVITLQNSAGTYELVKVIHHLAGSDTLGSATYPCVRAYWDGTTNPAAAWTSTDCVVDLRPVAQVMASFSSGMYGANNLSDVSSAATSRTNLGISAANTPFTPTGAIVATDTQNAVAGVDAALSTHKTASGAHSAANVTYGGTTGIPAGTVDSAFASVGTSLSGKQASNANLTAIYGMAAARATDLAALSAFIGTLLNDADADTARATLEIAGSAVRHTVLGGPVDASGYPAPGGSTGSAAVTTTAITASAPLVVWFANGFSALGEINLLGISTSNLTWSGLSTNGTMYLYVDYNAGALTPGSTTLAPVYQNGGTYSTTSGQATFNIAEMVMKVGNGSAAVQTNRVFVGEVTVAGGVVTAITWYAYRGEYVSADTAIPATGTVTAFSHNLGVTRAQISGELVCQTSELGYAAGEIVDAKAYYNSGTYAIAMPTATLINGKSGSITTGYSGGGFIVVDKLSSPGSTAPITAAKWKMRFSAKRGW